MAKDLYRQDLYFILDVAENATDKEIIRGYRKKALKCHPDKNPDNPKAAELFHELSRALEILTDPAARAAYDQTRKAKKAADERNKALDSKRKKFKEDLEARERVISEHKITEKKEEAEKKLQKEIERLRKEGSRLLEQEQERLRQELKHPATNHYQTPEHGHAPEVARLKLKWKVQKDDLSNGGYSADLLQRILGCYGQINTLIVSSKRRGSAIVEFEDSGVTSDILDESGLKENPFTIVWLSGKPVTRTESSYTGSFSNGASVCTPNLVDSISVDNSEKSNVYFISGNSFPIPAEIPSRSIGVMDKNFESIVLMNMRQAEERKRLIEQMKKEDDDDNVL